MSLTILVTGATAGFGQAIARRCVRDGHRVIAAARRQGKLDELAASLGPAVLPFRLDVTDAAGVAALPDALPEGWREVDVLVNNAGLALGLDPAHKAQLSDWDTMVATNVTGLMHLTHAFLPGMVARDRGHIVNISSTAAIYPYPGGHVYGASKAFVTQFSLNLRADLVGTGVRVSDVEPGLVGGTEFSRTRFRGDADRGGYRRGGGLGDRPARACQRQPRRTDADLPGQRPARDQTHRLNRPADQDIAAMRVLTAQDIATLVDVAMLIPVIAAAMRLVSARAAELPLRTAIPVGGANRLGVMPGALSQPAIYGAKLLSLFPGNPAQGRSSHAGLMLVFDGATGLPLGCLDAAVLTALRTAAASAVATDALARGDATNLAIIGTGEQAGVHIAAMRAVRSLSRIAVWGRDARKTHGFAVAHAVDAAVSLEEAVGAADIVCTATASAAPFLTPEMLPPGVHVNAVGGSVPAMRELSASCLAELRLVTDYRPSLEAQAGEVIEARALGLVPPQQEFAEIGEVLSGAAPGRSNAAVRTLYRSLGVAAQDLAAAQFILDRAAADGIGTVVA